jgi:hypothetical protein
MRPRAGSQPVTLEPPQVAEILAIARDYDERLKVIQQDLFRVETKLRIERKGKWPKRAACVALGAAALAAAQSPAVRTEAAGLFAALGRSIEAAENTSLTALIVMGVLLGGLVYLVRRLFRKPTPEQQARQLMEQFAQRNGVAAYVFANDSNADDEATTIGALTRTENKTIRQRHFTASHRTFASRLTGVLNRVGNTVSEPLLH